jgi:hypothetical protein
VTCATQAGWGSIDKGSDEDSFVLLSHHSASSEAAKSATRITDKFEGLRVVYYVMLDDGATTSGPAIDFAAAEAEVRKECAELEARAVQLTRTSLQVSSTGCCVGNPPNLSHCAQCTQAHTSDCDRDSGEGWNKRSDPQHLPQPQQLLVVRSLTQALTLPRSVQTDTFIS